MTIPDVWFVGRLATYRYYNMDQVVGQALSTFRRINDWVPVTKRRSAAGELTATVRAPRRLPAESAIQCPCSVQMSSFGVGWSAP